MAIDDPLEAFDQSRNPDGFRPPFVYAFANISRRCLRSVVSISAPTLAGSCPLPFHVYLHRSSRGILTGCRSGHFYIGLIGKVGCTVEIREICSRTVRKLVRKMIIAKLPIRTSSVVAPTPH